MQFVSGEEMGRVLSFPALVAALEASHAGPRMEIQDHLMGTEQALYFVRSAADHGRAFGSKLVTSFPGNLEATAEGGNSLPAVHAVYVLLDGRTGRPLAVLDGTALTSWKTAADSALGAKLLAPAEPRTFMVVGAGAMAPWLVRAHRSVRPSIREVLVWNRTPERARQLVGLLRAEQIDAAVVSDLKDGMRRAQLVSSCTRSHTPLIRGEWLRAGTHLDLVGGYTPDTREADDEAARRARIFVDRRETAFDGVGDILQPIASGAIRAEDVLGDLYDLIGGTAPGRLGPDDITLFKNAGGGHLDLMTAQAVMAQLGGG
jgi:ornithine cyclodeaminase/alanine dehydrogenase-like protein (mu-crystallin family)